MNTADEKANGVPAVAHRDVVPADPVFDGELIDDQPIIEQPTRARRFMNWWQRFAAWSSPALTDIATKLRNGAQDLGNVANSAPPGPDAGTSSQVVGDALVAWVTAAATAAARMETSADKVNAATGAYDQTEESNTNKVSSAGTTNSDQQNFQNTNYGSPSMIYPG